MRRSARSLPPAAGGNLARQPVVYGWMSLRLSQIALGDTQYRELDLPGVYIVNLAGPARFHFGGTFLQEVH